MLSLYELGEVDWLVSQAVYHALARHGEEGIAVCWPRDPYACLGCHESAEDFDPTSGIPVVRRRVGGSLVYLDANQIFFQIVLAPERVAKIRHPADWYRFLLGPVVACLGRLGIPSVLHPPADILAEGRKISGNAGGNLHDRVVVVGNLLLDFSFEAMGRVRAVPHPMVRRAFVDSMRQNIATLKDLRQEPGLNKEELMRRLSDAFVDDLGATRKRFPWGRWEGRLAAEGKELTREEWVMGDRARAGDGRIKVREGVYLTWRKKEDGEYSVSLEEGETVRRVPDPGARQTTAHPRLAQLPRV